MVKLTIFTEYLNKYGVRSDTYINPNASNATLLEFARQMNSLTDNDLGEVYRKDGFGETDLTPITRDDISTIVNRQRQDSADSNPVTRQDIEDFMEGN